MPQKFKVLHTEQLGRSQTFRYAKVIHQSLEWSRLCELVTFVQKQILENLRGCMPEGNSHRTDAHRKKQEVKVAPTEGRSIPLSTFP